MITPQLLATARDYADGYDGVSIAFVSGSLVEGFGTPNSDLDLFLIGEERPSPVSGRDEVVQTFDFDGYQIDIDYAGGVRIDAELWRLGDATRIATELSGWEPTSSRRPPEGWFQFAHRVRVGRGLFGTDRLERLRERFDWAWIAVLLARCFLDDYSALSEDAAGAVMAGDSGTALLSSRWALGAAVDAYVATHGETNAKPKWRFAKLRRLGDADLLARYLAAETEGAADEAQVLEQARLRLRTAASLAQRAHERLRPKIRERAGG